MLAGPAAAQEGEAEPVVPPGQDAVLAALLGRGATLPDGCRFASGQADGAVIRATYACPKGSVVVDLTHPVNAGPDAIRTAQFAIALRQGQPSDQLADAIVGLIQSREDTFMWGSAADDHALRAQADIAAEDAAQ